VGFFVWGYRSGSSERKVACALHIRMHDLQPQSWIQDKERTFGGGGGYLTFLGGGGGYLTSLGGGGGYLTSCRNDVLSHLIES
jgi:hypothetical protein